PGSNLPSCRRKTCTDHPEGQQASSPSAYIASCTTSVPFLPGLNESRLPVAMSASRGVPSCLLIRVPAMPSSRCSGLATVTAWNFSSSLRKGVEDFKRVLQSATTSAVSLALPVTATPEVSSIVLRISLRENGSFGGPASVLSGAKREGEGLLSGEALRPRSGPHAASENVIMVTSSRAARLRRRVQAEATRSAA